VPQNVMMATKDKMIMAKNKHKT